MTVVSAATRFCGTVMAGALVLSGEAAAVEAPKDTAACQRLSETLYKQAEALEKKTRIKIPREFVRVSADLDDFCGDKNFDKARVSADWMETCLANWRKPYKLGYCSRDKKYSCAVYPDSEACKGH